MIGFTLDFVSPDSSFVSQNQRSFYLAKIIFRTHCCALCVCIPIYIGTTVLHRYDLEVGFSLTKFSKFNPVKIIASVDPDPNRILPERVRHMGPGFYLHQAASKASCLAPRYSGQT